MRRAIVAALVVIAGATLPGTAACGGDGSPSAGTKDAGADGGPVDVVTPADTGHGPGDATDATDGSEPGDGDATDADSSSDVPLPPLVAECSACHDLAALVTAKEGAGLAPREWMELSGEGLVRRELAIAVPGIHLTLTWPRRGSHAPGGCGGCHPVDAQGIGHGVRAYAAAALAFAPGASCGGGCHGWIPDEVTARGFEGASGERTITVSMRPEALLQGADNAHADLWREGAHPDASAGLRISLFNPGCGGCHNLEAESHGAMLGCLDCHGFGGPGGELHTAHVALIADHMEDNDMDMAAMGAGPCGYCHTELEPSPRSSAACYNCHLSGHQPLDAAGQAHFWPTLP